MYYEYRYTIPKSTSEASPVEQTLRLSRGIIHHFEVQFPPGCHGLVRLRLYHGEKQVFPLNRDGYISGDFWPISFREHHELTSAPYELKLRAWNLDDTYPHDVIIRLGVLPEEVLLTARGMRRVLSGIRRRLRILTGGE